MKRVLILLLAAGLAACTTKTIMKTPPPGQVKKVTGSQSAKPYAPGQTKKASVPPGQAKKKN